MRDKNKVRTEFSCSRIGPNFDVFDPFISTNMTVSIEQLKNYGPASPSYMYILQTLLFLPHILCICVCGGGVCGEHTT